MVNILDKKRGIVLTVTLIFIIVLTIFAGVTLTIMTNQARLIESQIKRTRAFYTAEAAMVYALQQLREGSAFTTWTVNLNSYTATAAYTAASRKLTSTVQYNVGL